MWLCDYSGCGDWQTLAHIHDIAGYLVNGSARMASSDGFKVIRCDLIFPTINPGGNLSRKF